MEYDIILVRFGEMTLKKKNYKQFLDRIIQNIKKKCSVFPELTYSHTDYRFYIYLNGVSYEDVIERLNLVTGLYSYSLCKVVKKVNDVLTIENIGSEYDNIASVAAALIKEEIKDKKTSFKVETNRGNKKFPATSIEISQEIAKRVLPQVENLYVDVHNPEIVLSIDLRYEGTYVFLNDIKGLGGYPGGMNGYGLLMMSGGLDSPVAGFLSIKKGVNLKAIHYFSPPYTSLNALQKVVDLLEKIAIYSYSETIELYVVPFTKIQDRIHEKANQIYMVTLMRRAMYKIGDSICRKKNIDVIINGESIGQVASQTLESMRVVNDVTNIPIIRPLATYDKEDIVQIARKIGTYDISIRPYEDCCTVFVPEHPVIKPELDKVLEEEAKCDFGSLIDEAIENTKKITLNTRNKYSVFGDDNIEI